MSTNILHRLPILIAAATLLGLSISAQDVLPEGPYQRIELRDGSVILAQIVAEDEATIEVRTALGDVLTIQRANIETTRRLAGHFEDGRYVRYDPHRSRLMFAPTARPVEAGAGYFASYLLFFPMVAVGVTNNITMSGGMTLFPGSTQIVYLAPKVSFFKRGRGGLGAGVLAGTRIGEESNGDWAGILYGMGSLGDETRAVTAGVGFGFSGRETEGRPAFMVGGDMQVSNNVKLMTENYVLTGLDEPVILSGGVRLFGERLAADLSLIVPIALLDEGWPAFPFVSFAYKFGN